MMSLFDRVLRVAVFALLAAIADLTILVQARIIEPLEKEICLAQGDTLHLVCEEGHPLPASSTVPRSSHLIWTRRRFPDKDYNSMDNKDEFYTVAKWVHGQEIRDLYKHNVSVSDSAEYRCLNHITPSDTVNVTVVNVFIRNATIERTNEDAKLEFFPTELPAAAWNISWFRAGHKIENVARKYTLNPDNGTLIVHRVVEKDVGEYTCVLNFTSGSNLTKVLYLFSHPIVKSFEKSQNLREGSDLQIKCNVWGWPTPRVTWYRDDQPLNVSIEKRLSFANDTAVTYSHLMLKTVNFGDRANYMCSATSSQWPGVASNSTILIRIKGRLAALWPFLGICAEAVVLAIIIFIYERNRMKKKEAAEENCDGSKHQANCMTSGNADNLRHRK